MEKMEKKVSLYDLIEAEKKAVEEYNRIVYNVNFVLDGIESYSKEHGKVGKNDQYIKNRMVIVNQYEDKIPSALKACEDAKSAILEYFK